MDSKDQLDNLRDKMNLAKRAGEWLSTPKIHIVLCPGAFWRRMTTQGEFRRGRQKE